MSLDRFDDTTTALTAVAGAQEAIRRADGKAAALATWQVAVATTAYANVDRAAAAWGTYPVPAGVLGATLAVGLLGSLVLLGLAFWPRLAGAYQANRLAFPALADRTAAPQTRSTWEDAWDLAITLARTARTKFRLVRYALAATFCSTTAFVGWLLLCAVPQ
jgi:hypothetical protein